MRLNFKWFRLSSAVLITAAILAGCAKDELVKPANDLSLEERGLTAGSSNVALLGLTATNELVNLMSGPPVVDQGVIPITGLRDGELVLGIDKRQSTGEIFGVTNMNYLYRIDPATGLATAISTTEFNPAISGHLYGVDINPQDNLLRVITESGQALKISLATGLVTGTESAVNLGSATGINSVAYLPFFGGTTKPPLYELDITTNALYRQTAFGSLQYVGSTGFSWTGDGGFEITSSNFAFTAQYGYSRVPVIGFDDATQPAYRLHKIDLRSGKATSLGKVRPMIGLTSR